MVFDRHLEQIRNLAANHDGPFYVYSLEQIELRALELIGLLPETAEVFYSLKANSHPKIVKALRKSGLKADVASAGELEVALQAGYHGSDIEFTGPGKTINELEMAVQCGATVIVESTQELEAIEKIAASLAKPVSVHVRLQPAEKVNHVGRTQVGEFSQFGFGESEFASFKQAFSQCRFTRVTGTHTHVQSQILNLEFALANYRAAAETAARFAAALGTKDCLAVVNLGGGLGIPYSTSETPVSLQEFGQRTERLLSDLAQRAEFGNTKFRFEFGRLLVGEAGAFVTKVLYTKTNAGKKVAITDGGFTQSQIACGVGQTVRRNLPIRAFTSGSRSSVQDEAITIAGPSCYGLDILGHDVSLPALVPGDFVVIENVGAYGLSFSPGQFLRQRQAHEFFI